MLDVATVAQQRQARAITRAAVGRFVILKPGSIFGIQRLGAAARGFKRQGVPVRKFLEIGIGSRQPVGHCAFGSGDFGGRFATEDTDGLARIEVPVIAANERFGKEGRIVYYRRYREPIAVPRPVLGECGIGAAGALRSGGYSFLSGGWS